ncbi:glycosyltransferase family 2 protein [Methanoregula sp.]|uniref:glycosyltransferase family 2 protein n=1 Tax=Methanoregula sp. TaxID=2052170 RepID=UPI003C7110F2
MYDADKTVATIVIVTYKSENEIKDCINSLVLQSFKAYEIIIVDNSPDNDTVNIVKKDFPFIKLIKNKKNSGYGAGNNIGVKLARGEYIVILNPDTVVDRDWLKELLKPIITNERIITTSKILTKDGRMINTCGNIIHFTGLAFTRGYGMNPDSYPTAEYVEEFSGCSFAIKKSIYLKLGGFDDNIFLYHDDVDFSIRAQLNGFKILYVPHSIVFHDYQLKVSPEKIYFLEKGRYIILRKYLTTSDFVRIWPSLLMAELLTLGYSSKFGVQGLRFKMNAIKDGLSVESKKYNKEREDLFHRLNKTIPVDQLTFTRTDKIVKIIANLIFELNMRMIK